MSSNAFTVIANISPHVYHAGKEIFKAKRDLEGVYKRYQQASDLFDDAARRDVFIEWGGDGLKIFLETTVGEAATKHPAFWVIKKYIDVCVAVFAAGIDADNVNKWTDEMIQIASDVRESAIDSLSPYQSDGKSRLKFDNDLATIRLGKTLMAHEIRPYIALGEPLNLGRIPPKVARDWLEVCIKSRKYESDAESLFDNLLGIYFSQRHAQALIQRLGAKRSAILVKLWSKKYSRRDLARILESRIIDKQSTSDGIDRDPRKDIADALNATRDVIMQWCSASDQHERYMHHAIV